MAENIGDTSRLQEGRGFSMLDTLRARPQANRLIEDFYNFGVEGKRKLGSGTISLEEYGKLSSQNGVKKQLTAKFDEMRAIRAESPTRRLRSRARNCLNSTRRTRRSTSAC